ncbi:MAG: hypothetical protein ACLFQV_10325 [Vulcanimicrobiota bacterium]
MEDYTLWNSRLKINQADNGLEISTPSKVHVKNIAGSLLILIPLLILLIGVFAGGIFFVIGTLNSSDGFSTAIFLLLIVLGFLYILSNPLIEHTQEFIPLMVYSFANQKLVAGKNRVIIEKKLKFLEMGGTIDIDDIAEIDKVSVNSFDNGWGQ